MDALADDVGLIVPPLLIIFGLVGIVVPVLPGLLLILGGVLLWAVLEGGTVAWSIFAVSLVVAVIGWVLQYTLPGKRMRERGVRSRTCFSFFSFSLRATASSAFFTAVCSIS